MSRRLAEMTERNLEEGGRSAQKAVEEAGFDEELKTRLLERIAGASFKSQNASAFAEVNMPSSAGQGTRAMAAGRAWTGTEAVEDAALRMLDDAHKRIRVPSKIPTLKGPPPPRKVDTGRPKSAPSTGARLANARDRSSMYAVIKDNNMSEAEREQYRKELKERFTPVGRPMPTSLNGLATLANERIEDAIARGQFKNIPRGQKIERDYNMSSPFLDTTEYFMNKIIQKQDIVPPWIEKQQEVASTATKFRSRLRVDWRRHAARTIASRGGSLESLLRLAERYAAAEAIDNPPAKSREERINTVDDQGHLSQITLSGELKVDSEPALSEEVLERFAASPTSSVATAQPDVRVDGEKSPPATAPTETAITITVEQVDPSALPPASSKAASQPAPAPHDDDSGTPPPPLPTHTPLPAPFRDPHWESTERSYHALAIENLNSLTRSYNLMAPNVAKKPYFSLARELRSCYADVAPQLAGEIRQRALAPKTLRPTVEGLGRGAGVLGRLGQGDSAKVYDERKPQYGLKELWRDLFA